MYAIIGGSGFEKFEGFEVIENLDRETPFGLASSGFKKVRLDGKEILFISRHGDHHEYLPSEINYRANIFALKKWGAKGIISVSAVGSLDKNLAPGDLVVPNQYIDRTKGLRAHSFLGGGLIGHVSLAKPTCEVMESNLFSMLYKSNSSRKIEATISLVEAPKSSVSALFSFPIHFKKTYVCIEGPYFSTKAESLSYRQMGADIIGMSNFPEYALAREAGLPYLPCCFVTDYDCWDVSIPHVTVEEVIKVMRGNNAKAIELIKCILKQEPFWIGSQAPEGGLRTGLFMSLDAIPKDKNSWLEILRS